MRLGIFSKSRFSILGLFLVINLITFAILRLALLAKQWADIDTPFYQITFAFVMGAIHDLAFYSYFLIPFTLYLLVIPNRWYQSKLHKWFVFSGFLLNLYGLFFLILSEWTFWDEFGVRFNFIAVDYLIYTHEVVQNIIESYPLGKLLTGILIITIGCFWLVKSTLVVTFYATENFKRRAKIAGILFLLPIASYFAIGRTTYQFSQNTYLNEVAANGAYQFSRRFAIMNWIIIGFIVWQMTHNCRQKLKWHSVRKIMICTISSIKSKAMA